ncbi:MAG: nucleotide exchange factor GrpE [Eggerthellaceae bacterium]|nr:nucleotide exchange factor GrpE [Eggerthellaceae bacterium]
MVGRKKNAKEKDDGVKIPIEGAADEKSEDKAEAVEAEIIEDAEEAEVETEEIAEELAEDDLIAEAEAIVEEAAAADDVEQIRKEAQDWQDRYMRLHAEWDTYRRRTSEQREEEKARATEKLVENIIPVLDDFERSIDYADKNGEAGLLEGVRAVYTKLVDVLTKGGVAVIDPAGEPFDALQAQAVGTVPDEEAYDETVRDVYQKGYRMGKKVIRPAMVTVTTGGPARPKEEPEE